MDKLIKEVVGIVGDNLFTDDERKAKAAKEEVKGQTMTAHQGHTHQ